MTTCLAARSVALRLASLAVNTGSKLFTCGLDIH